MNLKISTRCYLFAIDVINFLEQMEYSLSNKIITHQLIRSACSIGANVVEAKASGTRLEYKRYFQIGLKSSNETLYWLNILKDKKSSRNLDQEKLKLLIDECSEISKIIGKSVVSLKNK